MANSTVIIPLSGSTQGKAIKVVATATPGTTIHATGTSATVVDRVYLFAQNNHTADVLFTVEFGGVASPDNLIILPMPFKSGLVQVCAGTPLLGNGSAALSVLAFAATANVITVYGYILRVTP